jgi:hypothetical protein
MSTTLYEYTGTFDSTIGKFTITGGPIAVTPTISSGITYYGYDNSFGGVYEPNGTSSPTVLISNSSTLTTSLKNLVSDPSGSSFAAAYCLLAGTMVATETGEARIEDLVVGQKLRLADGSARPIIWIGSRRFDCTRHPQPAAVLPVRVSAHAFGENLPCRDLFLSPEHAIFVEGVLVPVKHLINETSVVQIEAAEITYWHVELESHDVILAENLPVETLRESEGRMDMEGHAAMTLHPMFAGTTASPIAPIVTQGAILGRIRAKLAKIAAGPMRIAA